MTAPARPEPGTRLLFRWRKWDGSPHWEHDCVYLGSDEWGDWFGQRAGWTSARPGRAMTADEDNVTLVPPTGDFAFTRNALPHRTHTYIDLAWDLGWQGGVPVGIDMDLDVVDRTIGGVFIDDEDEWAEHRVQFGYPQDIVERLEHVAADLEQRVRNRVAPFDEAVPETWLARLQTITEGMA